MKLVAILRIKNEIDLIHEALEKLSSLADEIIIVDNGSTDGTLEAYKDYPKVIEVIETSGFNEGRDKIILLESAKKRQPDWILFLDADEIFENNFTRSEIEQYMRSKYDRINFRMCHFWLDKKHCRFDRKYFLYSLQPLRCMWRNRSDVYFRDEIIHNGDIQGNFKKIYFSPYRLKHLSLVNRQRILNKIKLYESVDNGVRNYSHMNPDLKFFTYPFLEFSNKHINYIFIWFLKYFFHFLWFWGALIFYLQKFFKK